MSITPTGIIFATGFLGLIAGLGIGLTVAIIVHLHSRQAIQDAITAQADIALSELNQQNWSA